MASSTKAAVATTGMSPGRRNAAYGVYFVGLVISIYALVAIPGKVGILGLTPVFVFAIIALLGADIVIATIATLFLGAIMTGSTPVMMGKLLAESLGSFISVVGLIIILGSGAGEVTARTGAAEQLVRAIVSKIGLSNQTRVRLGKH